MKTITNMSGTFSSLTIAFFIITFSGSVAAQTLPSATELLAYATAKSFPRSVDVATLKSAIDWEDRWTVVQNRVDPQYVEILPKEPLIGTAWSKVNQLAFTEIDKTLLPAALWLRTGNPAAASEAKRRALNLASWSPTGITGYLNNDLAAARIARSLALAYDWLHGQWTPTEQATLLSAIHPRLQDILGSSGGSGGFGLDNGLRMATWPYDSHRSVTTANTAVICTVLAGIDPLYDQCIINIVPGYLAWPIPWGWADGGFAGGTNYALWDVGYLHFEEWGMLKQTIGVDLWQTPWAQNYHKFMAYFLPPGALSGVFGDGAEQRWTGPWSTQAKTAAGYLPSPLTNWYARNLSKEQKYKIALLFAPQQNMNLISTALPTGTPHGIHIPSIGWVAMHSDLEDLSRTSVYFKSSSYGSYVHSHADQNSFVIHAGGQVLAVDSGYYDYWGSPHYKGWYKATRAHNAITFDGGLGQMQETITAKGKITQFENTPDYDLVTGDAVAAYGGALTKAVRSMVYLRPNTLVIFDSLTSGTPRTWEWNIHSQSPMIIRNSRIIEIDQGNVQLCVRMVSAGPNMAFSQTDQFTAAPYGTQPNQWHGTFSSLEKSTIAVFVTVLEVGCGWTPLTLVRNGYSRDITVMGNTFSFDGNTVTVK